MDSPTARPNGKFLGYMARKPWKPKGDWNPTGRTGVIEVCSASDCMCEKPAGWVERWDFNRSWSPTWPGRAQPALNSQSQVATTSSMKAFTLAERSRPVG